MSNTSKYKYNSKEYKRWRTAIYYMFGHTCQMCGKAGGRLNVHHIRPKAKYPSYIYDKKNGIVLCLACHRVVTGNEALFFSLFNSIIYKSLTYDFVYKFFSMLSVMYPNVVRELKKKRKWKLIPEMMVLHVNKSTVK